ncbi:heterokaryon incompatibility protein-domain-containing protein [Lasiosphaeria hispida]|uniref:Heterokaryon incompatibility protein-domain-containing protein n=1 Tax=Lasiosphaeria hispida TaxID=260671 RepID=A0AAJ0MKT1_9PEZI|nr:heterokaryon incompatibility protein-domain-containing protein [Lasiosphaeria hispida]
MVVITDLGVWWYSEISWERSSNGPFAAEFQSELPSNASYAVSSGLTANSPHSLLLRKWLRACDESHFQCRQQPEKKNFWPKRVINVGDTNKLTLVEEKPQGEHYLVLSHCWGPLTDQDKKRFCTTSENYGSRKLGFSYGELPKTFRDAIQATRALQKQYLWIDALCIIQEGPDCDWEDEAKTMADIFAYAYCTIAASSARGWGDGFLKPQSDSPDTGVQGILSTLTCACDFDKDVDKGPLMKRAWVLQERVLSRRIIHFSAAHTYCECGDGVLCEQLTKLKPPPGKQYFILDPNFPRRVNLSGFKRTVDFIHFLFKEYSASGLSYDTDRDVAIHSLVERVGKVLQTEVRHGIFRRFLGSLLLWRRTQENKSPPISYKVQTVPSWSWLAYSGGIDFISDAKWDLLIPHYEDLGFADDGQALNVKVRQFGGNFRMGKKGEECAIVDGTKEVGFVWFDVTDQIQLKDCNCVVVSMLNDDKKDPQKTYHVLIIRKKARDGEYERVGVGKVEAQYVSTDGSTGTLW